MALPIPGLRSLPLPSPPSPPRPPLPSVPLPLPDRALLPTLRRIELAVWTLCVVITAVFLAVSVAGAFVVASRPLTLPMAALLAAVILGTLAFVGGDFVFE